MTLSDPSPHRRPRIVAHRGGAGEAVQNSLTAFHACVGAGIDGVEFDVHRAADGGLVVHHDAWLDRSTDMPGPVAARTAAELAAARLNGAAEGLPGLGAALDALAADPTLDLHLEIKTDHLGRVPEGLIDDCLGAAAERGLIPRLVLVSFRVEDIQAARALSPGLRTALAIQLSTAWMVGGLEALARGGLEIEDCLLSLETLLLRNSLELMLSLAPGRLGVWNADAEADIGFWLDQPVEQIVTDRPRLALAMRDGAG